LAFAHPVKFATLLPIAGFVNRVPMIENCKIKNIPIRIEGKCVKQDKNIVYDVKKKKLKKLCSYKKCKKRVKKELMVKCNSCQGMYCIYHRFKDEHGCNPNNTHRIIPTIMVN